MDNSEINQNIITLSMQGLTARQISEIVGLEHQRVVRRVARMVQRGVLPRSRIRRGLPPAQDPRHTLRGELLRQRKTIGTMHELDESLTPEEVRFIASQVPKGGSLVGLLSAIIRDLYEEEGGQ